VLDRPLAAAGKDADPKECPWHFEASRCAAGDERSEAVRRQAAISGRRKHVRISRRNH